MLVNSSNPQQFEIVTTTAGAISIRDNLVNEIMHNPVGPWVEANSLYIEQSNLKGRLQDNSSDELVVYDIGLGAGANALAALHCLRSIRETKARTLRLISFEKNLELLKFALRHSDRFDHFRGFEIAVEAILNKGIWIENAIHWELKLGDFRDFLDASIDRPHLIFFDPYSPKANQEVWTTNSFQKLRSICRSEAEGGTVLYTYSQATPIRTALLASDFFVGQGSGTGLKPETTQAATLFKDINCPLSDRWISRWKNSHTPYPYDCLTHQEEAFRLKILKHPQFNFSATNSL